MKSTLAAKKDCTNCGVEKDLSDFHRSSKASDGHASWCKACTNSIAREQRKRTYSKENKRKWQLMTRYRMTSEDLVRRKEEQNGNCAICGCPLANKFHVDHDHNTGKVRGILCHRCNIRLGGWDDVEWRVKAIKYLGLDCIDQTPEAAKP